MLMSKNKVKEINKILRFSRKVIANNIGTIIVKVELISRSERKQR